MDSGSFISIFYAQQLTKHLLCTSRCTGHQGRNWEHTRPGFHSHETFSILWSKGWRPYWTKPQTRVGRCSMLYSTVAALLGHTRAQILCQIGQALSTLIVNYNFTTTFYWGKKDILCPQTWSPWYQAWVIRWEESCGSDEVPSVATGGVSASRPWEITLTLTLVPAFIRV